MEKIKGQSLIGFGDYFEGGYAVVGAPAPRKPPAKPAKPPAKQARPYPKAKVNTTVQQHGKVLHASRAVVTRAVKSMNQARQLLAKKPVAKPVHVGAAAAAAMTPKQRAAVAKHNDAAVKAAKATKALAQHALKVKASATALAKRMVVQKKAAQTMRKPTRGRTHVGALFADDVGAAVAQAFRDYYTTVGAVPDPTNPGYLDDGTPDPAYAAGDPSLLDPSLGDPGALVDSPLDDGTTLPPPPDISTFIPDMTLVGGIAYNGEKGRPDGYVVSLGLVTRSTDHYVEPNTTQIDGTEHHGYVFGVYDMNTPVMGIPWGSNLEPGKWNHVHGRYHLGDSGWHEVVDPSEAYQSYAKNSTSAGHAPYGPIVGNPVLKDFAGMRVDGKGNEFWFPQEAPDWLTFPLKQAAALTAQAAAKAQKDADAADAAAQAKSAADAAAAQAAQDAQNALSESQAASESRVQQAQAETQAQQSIVQQAQADTQQQQLDIQQAKESGELVLAQARRQQEYLAQHPELEFGPQGGGEDDQEPTDDMRAGDDAAIPGGDIMEDNDGEGFDDPAGSGFDEDAE